MTAFLMTGAHAPTRPLIDAAIAKHGAMHVMLAAIRALLRVQRQRRARPPDITQLDARLRKDVGLLPDLDRPVHRMMF